MQNTDEALILSYREGEKESIDTLFTRYLPATYSFLVRLTNNENIAEDATSEAFYKAWKYLDRFNAKEPFKPWLFKIARNTAYDLLRKRKLFVFSDFETEEGENPILETLQDMEPLPSEIFQRGLEKKVLLETIKTLSPPERELLTLYYEEELTFKEIGDILEKPLDTVKSQHRRILEKLRKRMPTMHH